MDENQSLERLLRHEEKRIGEASDRIPEELKRAIDETRRKMRAAFSDGRKIRATLKESAPA